MNILNPNIRRYMPEILDSFVEVYGKKNEALIKEHEKKIIYTQYNDPEGIKDHYDFLKATFANEMDLKYLKKIGVLDNHYELRKSYQKPPANIKRLKRKYLNRVIDYGPSSKDKGIKRGICSFKDFTVFENDQNYSEYCKEQQTEEQIKYLNNLRDKKEPIITKENYADFKKTEEFKILSKTIKSYLAAYNEVDKEYCDYLNEIEYLKTHYEKEVEIKNKLYKLEMLKIYDSLKDSYIPKQFRKILTEKFPTLEERVNFLLNFDPEDISLIEMFSSKNNDKLKNPNIPSSDKMLILVCRLEYFKSLGANIIEEDYKKYNEIIKNDEIKQLIPKEEFVDTLLSKKEKAREDIKKQLICESKEVREATKKILAKIIPDQYDSDYLYKGTKLLIKDHLYNTILDGKSCNTIISSTKMKLPVILILTKYTNAILDYVFIHELVHAIEFNECFPLCKTGFDIVGNKVPRNPYNKKKRIYERFNETITDMIVEKIRKSLLKKGIYIAEKRKLTDTKNVKNTNTDNILKIMLYPLFDKVSQELLDSRLTGHTLEFTNLIGPENFKDLNDVINKVDYLIQKEDLKRKLKKKNYNASTVIEYYIEQEKLKVIYQNIDERLRKNKENNKKLVKAI